VQTTALKPGFRESEKDHWQRRRVTTTVRIADLRAFTVMSLQVNLSSKDILTAYQSVLDGIESDWMLLTYEKGSNDLKVRPLDGLEVITNISSKVQRQGSGGLEELVEEFSDGRYVISVQ
jgi:hypothetical protein